MIDSHRFRCSAGSQRSSSLPVPPEALPLEVNHLTLPPLLLLVVVLQAPPGLAAASAPAAADAPGESAAAPARCRSAAARRALAALLVVCMVCDILELKARHKASSPR